MTPLQLADTLLAEPPAPPVPGRQTIDEGTGQQVPGVFKHVEVEIATACDLACHACDRFSDVTNAPNMTIDQIKYFVKESLELGWVWERIRILGGEPTLHPKFTDIVEAIMDYRYYHPKTYIQVLSNGLGKLKKHRDWLVYRGIDPHVEAKAKGITPHWFENTRLAPVDRDPNIGAVQPCGVFGIRGCGVGLTRHGYFLDGAGASVARVAGLDVGIMHLKDLTWEAALEQAKVLCRLCGKWNPPHPEPQVTRLVKDTGEVTGPYWETAIARYNRGETHKLRIYGAEQ